MEQQHKEMLRSLVAGGFDHLETDLQARSFQPGELADSRKGGGAPASAAVPAIPVPAPKPPPVEKPPPTANSLVETLFAEDLISEKSLDEVILRYLTDQIGK